MKPDIDTKLVALIGYPLGQSFAARMQNAAFEAMGLNWQYLYNEARGDCLGEIVSGIRFMSMFGGAAVTKPHKVAVMDMLDAADPLCLQIGACNTIVKTSNGALVGYNTDAIGFLKSLEEAGFTAKGKSFFVLGLVV